MHLYFWHFEATSKITKALPVILYDHYVKNDHYIRRGGGQITILADPHIYSHHNFPHFVVGEKMLEPWEFFVLEVSSRKIWSKGDKKK